MFKKSSYDISILSTILNSLSSIGFCSPKIIADKYGQDNIKTNADIPLVTPGPGWKDIKEEIIEQTAKTRRIVDGAECNGELPFLQPMKNGFEIFLFDTVKAVLYDFNGFFGFSVLFLAIFQHFNEHGQHEPVKSFDFF